MVHAMIPRLDQNIDKLPAQGLDSLSFDCLHLMAGDVRHNLDLVVLTTKHEGQVLHGSCHDTWT